MATEATFTIPLRAFPLGSAFETCPDAEVQLERVVPAGEDVVPYVWIRGAEIDDVEAAFDDHPALESVELVDAVEGEYLLRVEWAPDREGVLRALAETDVPLVEAVGTAEGWTLEVRGEERSDLAAFRRRCQELDVPLTLTELRALTPAESAVEAALTETQLETLALALERGYFETPREVTLTELGAELDVSEQAVASRLRRGLSNVLGCTLPME